MTVRDGTARFDKVFLIALLGVWLGVCACASAEAATPKRVLIIHSFGRDFAPYDTIASVFRAELAKGYPEGIVLSETTLDAGRDVTKAEERAFLEYLSARFAGVPPDLVVTIGPLAAHFYLAHRDELFAAPLIMSALDERLARGATLRVDDAAVVGKVDFSTLFDNIFQLLPDTTTIAVVTGKSRLEQFWAAEVKKDSLRHAGRARFEWLDELSLEQMKERVARLPPHSAVLYTLLIVDAAGVPHERQSALMALHSASSAPIFGLYEDELGKGVVGGPYSSQRVRGEQMAAAAISILRGESSEAPRFMVTGFEAPVYDWRELSRWNIDASRLPAGSQVRFKPLSAWEQYRTAIALGLTLILLQAVMIAALLWHRARRRHAERAARDLGGRLITAHEDERRRLARELHDDITQRLAALSIQAAELDESQAGVPGHGPAGSIREQLAELSDDVHGLSYRLHPTVIEDLGLVEALRSECERVSGSEAMRVELDTRAVPSSLPVGASVALYRVAQEALRNVARHANASDVRVALQGDSGRLTLAVRDNGAGFDTLRSGSGASLGLASMRERMRLLNGTLGVDSAPGRGTVVTASIPLVGGR